MSGIGSLESDAPGPMGLLNLSRAYSLTCVLLTVQACGGRSELDTFELHVESSGGATSISTTPNIGGDTQIGTAMGGLPNGGTGGTASTGGASAATLHWKNSTSTLCANAQPDIRAATYASVWSDARGVNLLLGEKVQTLVQNDGTGWKEVYNRNRDDPFTTVGLTGFTDGHLVRFGNYACGIEFLNGASATCSSASAALDVSTVQANLSYAVYYAILLKFDGTFWNQWGDSLGTYPQTKAFTVWASSDTVLVGANSGNAFIYSSTNSNVATAQSGLPQFDNTAAWGFAPDNLWLGNSNGQLLNYNGSGWSVAATIAGDCRAIRKMWGIDGTLFFITNSSVGLLSNGNVQMLAEYPCNGDIVVYSLWGNSVSEVFFAITDASLSASPCGDAQLLWYNGHTLVPI